MEFGKCKLCLEDKLLCNSHLVPAGLYRYCRAGELAPIRMTAKEIGHTNEELTAYLLCEKCEHLLNREGENWLMPKLATAAGSFPFYDLLVKGKPDIVEPDFVAYACARNKEIGFRKLTNFVIGVFWKASVHSWRSGRTDPKIDLGPYRESFRKFLIHEGKFPERARLTILVSPPEKAVIGFNLPEPKIKQPYHQYLFHIPGMMFMLAVGKRTEEDWERMCFYTHPLHPILVADISEGIFRSVNLATRNAIRRPVVSPFVGERRR